MARLVELVCGRHAGGAGTDDGYFLAGTFLGWLGSDPAFLKTLVDDGALDALDGNGRLNYAEHTGPFTGSGADPTSELGKVIRFM